MPEFVRKLISCSSARLHVLKLRSIKIPLAVTALTGCLRLEIEVWPHSHVGHLLPVALLRTRPLRRYPKLHRQLSSADRTVILQPLSDPRVVVDHLKLLRFR